MLDTATVVDPELDSDDEARGHEPNHRQSPHGDSTSSLTPSEERDRRQEQDDRDLRDVIYGRDARSQKYHAYHFNLKRVRAEMLFLTFDLEACPAPLLVGARDGEHDKHGWSEGSSHDGR
jgi:hypothetical protein